MTNYDRSVEDIGNVVLLEHVNIRVPDQKLATDFYVSGLGLTRDPYIMTGTTNMWINAGRSQFHLPTGGSQVLRGHTGIVIPGRDALLARLDAVQFTLKGTRFMFAEHGDYVDVTCPWGNLIRCFEPGPRFAEMRLGIPYVELEVPVGTAEPIARFYRDVLVAPASTATSDGDAVTSVSVGGGQSLNFREMDTARPDFDGHHVAIYLADFSGPYNRLRALDAITEESDQHQYRFLDIFDPKSGTPVFRLEHEVRSMRHPMYGRPLVNRNPAISSRTYTPGHEDLVWMEGVTS